MKLLFDENLSPVLVAELADVFQGSAHVRDVGLKSSADRRVWDYAVDMGFAIVTQGCRLPSAEFSVWSAAEGNLDRSGELLDETDRRATSQTEQRN